MYLCFSLLLFSKLKSYQSRIESIKGFWLSVIDMMRRKRNVSWKETFDVKNFDETFRDRDRNRERVRERDRDRGREVDKRKEVMRKRENEGN